MFILGTNYWGVNTEHRTESMVIFKDSATADEIAYIMELVKHAGTFPILLSPLQILIGNAQ
ncbi:hypothetical protein DXG01_007860 [Tephrocybe rancida]|nr:hypothetical protein DXG01_007860 [Tephrocybe rancida]